MTNRLVAGLAMIALVLAPQRAIAQQPARIDGVLTDSAHNKPLTDATVFIARREPAQPEFMRTLVTDRDGRYQLDSLVAGRYAVWFSHPVLDSLDLLVAPREVALTVGDRARVDFAIPSGATLRSGACPGFQLPEGTGALIGTVTDAETDRPLIGASVVVSWTDVAIDRKTLRATGAERTGAVRVDSAGVYRACGVRTGSVLALQVQFEGRAGSPLRTDVPSTVGFRRLDLSFSAKTSRALARASPSAVTAQVELLSGTASLAGTVRSSTGVPLADVALRVEGAAGLARTDSLGRFTLSGLPAGSQLLEARRIGFFIGRRPVELRSGRTIEVQLSLVRIVSLDSIHVVGQRSKYTEFEQNRRWAWGIGRFFTEEWIAERHAVATTDLFYGMPGLRVVGTVPNILIESTRGETLGGPCRPAIIIDKAGADIRTIQPSEIGAIEVYNNMGGGPPGANRGCGVIVIWTKR